MKKLFVYLKELGATGKVEIRRNKESGKRSIAYSINGVLHTLPIGTSDASQSCTNPSEFNAFIVPDKETGELICIATVNNYEINTELVGSAELV